MSKNDFHNKLISFNKNFISNKIKYLEVQKKKTKKLKSLTTKEYNFFVESILQAMMDLEIYLFISHYLKTRILIMFLIGNQREHILLNLSHCIRLFLNSRKLLDAECEENLIKIL